MTLQETYDRINRGMNEEFDIWPSETQAGAWHVMNAEKLTRYWVTMDSCSCPDWNRRCAQAGVPCKHQVALERWLIAMPEDGATACDTCDGSGYTDAWTLEDGITKIVCPECDLPNKQSGCFPPYCQLCHGTGCKPSAAEWLENLDMTAVKRHLAEDANEPDPSWVVGECPRCGAPLVENSRYVGGRGYVRSVECWRGLQDGRPDACYVRRGR